MYNTFSTTTTATPISKIHSEIAFCFQKTKTFSFSINTQKYICIEKEKTLSSRAADSLSAVMASRSAISLWVFGSEPVSIHRAIDLERENSGF